MSGATEDEKATILDTSKAERSVWLMKCPNLVAQAWKEISEAGQPLAKITVSVDPLRTDEKSDEAKFEDPTMSKTSQKFDAQEKPSTTSQTQSTPPSNKSQFTMELVSNGSAKAPKSYSLNMSTDIVPMYIFSETTQGKVAVDGKVEHKFDMKPNNQNIDDYRKLCRERTEKCQKSKGRQLQLIDNDRGGYNPMQGMMDFAAMKDKKKATAPVKAQEMKRTRMDRAELEDILFKLFERQSNWTLKQLVQETDQPQQFVKEVLTDLGNYNKKGTNQGTYELKPEYKKTTEDMETN